MEYVISAEDMSQNEEKVITPAEYVKIQEGTYNKLTGKFYGRGI